MGLEIFSTCPDSSKADPDSYVDLVIRAARWSEDHGCTGMLVYTDNRLVDPWLVAQLIIQNTRTLCPLVAVQPVYMHPYTVAKMVSSIGFMYGRRLYLNMVAGGFKNDLAALNDRTPHDKRYARLIDYTAIIMQLLGGGGLVNYESEFHKVVKLRLSPSLPPGLLPGIFMSGSSEAGLMAARAIGARAIEYPKPTKDYAGEGPAGKINGGIRIGIITRPDEEVAWSVAYERFPCDGKGRLTHQLAMKTSDSVWHKTLSEMAANPDDQPDCYWLVPFQNYHTFCPYLVGTYQTVARELARYIQAGCNTFILDIPPSEEELKHTSAVFELASELVTL